jgi:hypothetical protein
MTSKQGLARLAGLLYLIVAVCGGWAELSVRSSVKVPGDAAATAANVVENATLMRLAFSADLVNITCFLLVALVMYAILKPVDDKIALAMVVFNAMAVAIMGLNMLNHIGALLVATVPDYTVGLSSKTSNALVMLLLDMHSHGYLVGQIFFGLFLLPLGYLVYKSGYFPRVLGILLMLGCGGYLAGLVAAHLSPDFESSLTLYLGLPAGLAEVVFLLWLLVVGVRMPLEDKQGASAA